MENKAVKFGFFKRRDELKKQLFIIGLFILIILTFVFVSSRAFFGKFQAGDVIATLAFLVSGYTFFLQKEESRRARAEHEEFKLELERKASPNIVGNLEKSKGIISFKKTNELSIINSISYKQPYAFGNGYFTKSFGNKEELNIQYDYIVKKMSSYVENLRFTVATGRCWSCSVPIIVEVDFTYFRTRKKEKILFFIKFIQAIETTDTTFKGTFSSYVDNVIFEKYYEDLEIKESYQILQQIWDKEIENLNSIKKDKNIVVIGN